ncbi:MAG TPA: SUMF1/EgtB/PvdO family nonheme iron enzyme, partial [Saprospiraceae bacterium]|nr:SUMF1/EgtB/PvdO family nonheme iron enzyme [Saprospiraceae bacterium]
MNNLPEIQTTLKKLIADGANYGLKKLEEVLKPGTERYNDFIQIQGRYKNYLNAVIKGIASKAELDLQYNQITQALIYFADSICEEDLIQEEEPQESGPKRGELLYHVPPAMQTGQEHKCAVRVAYTKDAIVEDWEVQEGDVEKSIPVAEVMSVELLNVDESQPFAIRTFSDTIQYLDNDYFTEWEFYVKPLRHGSFPLLLKISMIETRNGREVKRNVVIEEHVVVSTEPVEEQAPEMKPANVSLDFGGAAPAGSPEIAAAPQSVASGGGSKSSSKPLRAAALFLAFIALGGGFTWAASPPDLRDWWAATLSNTAEAYEGYIQKYKAKGNTNPRLESAYYRLADKTNSLEHLRQYQEEYPHGKHMQEVEVMLDGQERVALADLQQQPSTAAVRQYLSDFPDARYLAQIKLLIDQHSAEPERTSLLSALEAGYVNSIRIKPTSQKIKDYAHDFPQLERLSELAEAANAHPPVPPDVQQALDAALVQKADSASSAAEIKEVLSMMQAAGSQSAVAQLEQSVAQKSSAVQAELGKQIEAVKAGVDKRIATEQAEAAAPKAAPAPSASDQPTGAAPPKPEKSGIEDMVLVSGGSYSMGSAESEKGHNDDECSHSVAVGSFYLAQYEVTQADWREVMGSDPNGLENMGCDDCPVEGVSWSDVQNFLKKLNAKTGKQYRLPTEAEWEYAARGGSKSQGYIFAGSNDLSDVAWNTENRPSAQTQPVGTRKANELGIYDMSGNVYEWCETHYSPYADCAQPG